MRNYWGFLLISALLVLSSCVGNKKLAYLQDKEAKGNDRYEKEVSVQAPSNIYLLQPGDVIYVNL